MPSITLWRLKFGPAALRPSTNRLALSQPDDRVLRRLLVQLLHGGEEVLQALRLLLELELGEVGAHVGALEQVAELREELVVVAVRQVLRRR